MADIIYRGSKNTYVSQLEMNNNFSNINTHKVEKTLDGLVVFPSGTTLERPAGVSNAFRFNTTTNVYQLYNNNIWGDIKQQGFTGSIGIGYTGSPGYRGSMGDDATGPRGFTGNPGYTGSRGPDGPASTVTGFRGSQGPQGAKGADGVQGPRGYVGYRGPTGLTGFFVQPDSTYLAAKSYSYINNTFSWRSTNDDIVGLENNALYITKHDDNITAPLILNRSADGSIFSMYKSGNICLAMPITSTSLTVQPYTSYNFNYRDSESDYRLKENLVKITSGSLYKINKIPTYYYNKIDSDNIYVGVLAHELQEVFPKFVTGEKDAVDETGSPIYQQVNYIGLLPDITLALQELSYKIQELKTAINNI